MAVAYDYFNTDKDAVAKATSVTAYDENLSVTGSKEISPDSKFISQATAYRIFKKGKEFSTMITSAVWIYSIRFRDESL